MDCVAKEDGYKGQLRFEEAQGVLWKEEAMRAGGAVSRDGNGLTGGI